VTLQCLVHGKVGGGGQPLGLPVLSRLQLEDLQQAIVPATGNVALREHRFQYENEPKSESESNGAIIYG